MFPTLGSIVGGLLTVCPQVGSIGLVHDLIVAVLRVLGGGPRNEDPHFRGGPYPVDSNAAKDPCHPASTTTSRISFPASTTLTRTETLQGMFPLRAPNAAGPVPRFPRLQHHRLLPSPLGAGSHGPSFPQVNCKSSFRGDSGSDGVLASIA